MVSNFFITNTLKCTSLDESASFEVGLYIVIGLIRLPVLADRTTCTLQQKCPNKCIGLSAHLRPVHNRQQSCQKLQQSGRKRQKKSRRFRPLCCHFGQQCCRFGQLCRQLCCLVWTARQLPAERDFTTFNPIGYGDPEPQTHPQQLWTNDVREVFHT